MNAVEKVSRMMVGTEPVTRSQLLEFQGMVSKMPNQIDPEAITTHHFAPGVYGRQMDLPKGSLIVGKLHKHSFLNILTKGVVGISSEFGREIVSAPSTWVSEAGIKRTMFAIEDVQMIGIHPNESDTRDMEKIERFVIADDYAALDLHDREEGARCG